LHTILRIEADGRDRNDRIECEKREYRRRQMHREDDNLERRISNEVTDRYRESQREDDDRQQRFSIKKTRAAGPK
jgi:hypothetical protein